MRRDMKILWIAMLCVSGLSVSVSAAGDKTTTGDDSAWPAPVSGFVPPQPGEHPRLLFRKADLPALRKKAGNPGWKGYRRTPEDYPGRRGGYAERF